ncbi:MAG TPA: Tox-REase-5 domain-containing protein [Pseudonocardiaceae bacterium]
MNTGTGAAVKDWGMTSLPELIAELRAAISLLRPQEYVAFADQVRREVLPGLRQLAEESSSWELAEAYELLAPVPDQFEEAAALYQRATTTVENYIDRVEPAPAAEPGTPPPEPPVPPVVREIGKWEQASESMSARAAKYQAQITGRTGMVYKVKGVKFDGYKDGVLQEAKGPGYANFVKKGQFQRWFHGSKGLREQAQRQVGAAGGTSIRWSVAEASAVAAFSDLFEDAGISGIEVVHVPPEE